MAADGLGTCIPPPAGSCPRTPLLASCSTSWLRDGELAPLMSCVLLMSCLPFPCYRPRHTATCAVQQELS